MWPWINDHYNCMTLYIRFILLFSLLCISLTFHNKKLEIYIYLIRSDQISCSVVSDSATPWMAARQASLSITNSPEFTKTHVHRVSDAIQPSHPLSSPSAPAPNPSSIRVFSSESTLCMRCYFTLDQIIFHLLKSFYLLTCFQNY